MPVFVVLLRGVNVLGKKRVRMVDWKAGVERLGFKNVRTYLQSGNAVFRAAAADPKRTAAMVKAGIVRDFGFDVEVLVLERPEIDRIADSNPLFPRLGTDESLFHATFLSRPVSNADFAKLKLPVQAGEQAVWGGAVIYLYCPHGYGRTKLNNSFFEKALGIPATTRNWRTVLALKALCTEP
jgi:uncharacterized protein (DUF1697 family)